MAAQIIVNTNQFTFERVFRFGAWCFVFVGLLFLVPNEGLAIVGNLDSGSLLRELGYAFPRLIMLSFLPLIAFAELLRRWRTKRGITMKEAAVFSSAVIFGVALCGLAVPYLYHSYLVYQGIGDFLTLINILTGSVVGLSMLVMINRRPAPRRR